MKENKLVMAVVLIVGVIIGINWTTIKNKAVEAKDKVLDFLS